MLTNSKQNRPIEGIPTRTGFFCCQICSQYAERVNYRRQHWRRRLTWLVWLETKWVDHLETLCHPFVSLQNWQRPIPCTLQLMRSVNFLKIKRLVVFLQKHLNFKRYLTTNRRINLSSNWRFCKHRDWRILFLRFVQMFMTHWFGKKRRTLSIITFQCDLVNLINVSYYSLNMSRLSSLVICSRAENSEQKGMR